MNTVTFRGQALDSTSVIIRWPSQAANVNNYCSWPRAGTTFASST